MKKLRRIAGFLVLLSFCLGCADHADPESSPSAVQSVPPSSSSNTEEQDKIVDTLIPYLQGTSEVPKAPELPLSSITRLDIQANGSRDVYLQFFGLWEDSAYYAASGPGEQRKQPIAHSLDGTKTEFGRLPTFEIYRQGCSIIQPDGRYYMAARYKDDAQQSLFGLMEIDFPRQTIRMIPFDFVSQNCDALVQFTALDDSSFAMFLIDQDDTSFYFRIYRFYPDSGQAQLLVEKPLLRDSSTWGREAIVSLAYTGDELFTLCSVTLDNEFGGTYFWEVYDLEGNFRRRISMDQLNLHILGDGACTIWYADGYFFVGGWRRTLCVYEYRDDTFTFVDFGVLAENNYIEDFDYATGIGLLFPINLGFSRAENFPYVYLPSLSRDILYLFHTETREVFHLDLPFPGEKQEGHRYDIDHIYASPEGNLFVGYCDIYEKHREEDGRLVTIFEYYFYRVEASEILKYMEPCEFPA